MTQTVLSRTEASSAVSDLGWRFLMNNLGTAVLVPSIAEAARVASVLAGVAGADADGHLRLDLRPTVVEAILQTASLENVTARDVELATAISAAVASAGYETVPTGERTVQVFEVAIDAMDIPLVRPFWRAVLGYQDERTPFGAVVDPLWQGPSVWFQQMDEPREQRNRIHFDLTVGHDEAAARIAAAIAAGGTLVSDEAAPSFWILADAEGNEVCICTWQGRDGDRDRT